MRLSEVLLVVLISAVSTMGIDVDCRRFSFAPACRGIILKRSMTPIERPYDQKQMMRFLNEVLGDFMLALYLEPEKDCVRKEWIINRFFQSLQDYRDRRDNE